MDIRAVRGAFEVHGDTYLVRETLRGLGGRWNAFSAAWSFPTRPEAEEALEAAKADLAVKKELEALEAT